MYYTFIRSFYCSVSLYPRPCSQRGGNNYFMDLKGGGEITNP